MYLSRSIIYLISLVVILLIPFIAMQYTEDINWSSGDFILAALFVGTFLSLFELIRRRYSTKQTRRYAILLLIFLFVLVVELAVGIFGSAIAGS